MSEIPAKYASLEQVSFPIGEITTREDGTKVFKGNSNVSNPPASLDAELTYEGRRYKGVLYLVEEQEDGNDTH